MSFFIDQGSSKYLLLCSTMFAAALSFSFLFSFEVILHYIAYLIDMVC